MAGYVACLQCFYDIHVHVFFSILAGCKALPPLLNIRQVMQQKQVSNVWSNKEELPVSFHEFCYRFSGISLRVHNKN